MDLLGLEGLEWTLDDEKELRRQLSLDIVTDCWMPHSLRQYHSPLDPYAADLTIHGMVCMIHNQVRDRRRYGHSTPPALHSSIPALLPFCAPPPLAL
eukprot:7498605-Pyramimonas_sp.AAC.1